MSALKIESLTKKYPGGTLAVDGISLDVADGESVAVFGLERSGKSTLLRMIAGLEDVTQGRILFDGKDVTDAPTKERNVAFAFQGVNLDQQASVYENLAYGLKLRKVPAAVIDVKVRAVAQILGLSSELMRKPKTLTAEKRRLVVFGRTIVRDPKVYLFDDALSGLDESLRESTLRALVGLQIRLNATFLYATDDIREAVSIGSRVAILREGKLVQIDTPERLFAAPADDFVAEIMGAAKKGE